MCPHSERLKLVLTEIEVQNPLDIKDTHTHKIRPNYTSANRWVYGFVEVEFAILPVPFSENPL